jgi:hypothetical protein
MSTLDGSSEGSAAVVAATPATPTVAAGAAPVIADVLEHAKDLYQVLGVEKGADAAAMSKARRQRHLALHPDKNDGGTEQSKRALQLVEDAYAQLSDPQRRDLYDLAQTVGFSAAAQQSLQAVHVSLAAHAIFSVGLSSSSSSAASSKPLVRNCSCGKPLAKPDDLLCVSCTSGFGVFNKAGRCKQLGCLDEVKEADYKGATPTEAVRGMCAKCAGRRKCTTWGCMRKCEAVDRDVCLVHHNQAIAAASGATTASVKK